MNTTNIQTLINGTTAKKKTTIEVDQELYNDCIKYCIKYNITFTALFHASLADTLQHIKMNEEKQKGVL